MEILIADDHPIFKTGVKDILESSIDNCSVTAVDNGGMAIEELKNNTYDIAILDIEMPEKDGLYVADYIKKHKLDPKVIILTMFKDQDIFFKAMEIGVDGFLIKEHSGKEMVTCINKVMSGDQYIGKGLEKKLADHKKIKNELEALLSNLTQAELKTLKLVSKNLTSKEIADRLFVTPKSIENYRSRICKKLMLPPGNNSLMKWVLDNKDLLKNL